MKVLRSLSLVVAIALGVVTVSAQLRTDSLELHFRQAHSEVDTTLADNGARINSMLQRLATSDSSFVVRNIRVVGAASPEGSAPYNVGLSGRRAHSIFNYLSAREHFGVADTAFVAVGRDWEGLRAAVLADTLVPARDRLIYTLDDIIASIDAGHADSQHNLDRIKAIDDGRTYSYIYTHIFPALRESRIYVDYRQHSPRSTTPPLTMTVGDLYIFDPVEIYSRGTAATCHPFYMALKTNMLHDIAALPSIGAEFYVGRNYSVVANWTYGWWDSNRRHDYWRAYGGDIAVRRWFGRKADEKPLTGHHLGLYAGVFTYDFELGGTGYMGGRPGHPLWDRFMVNAGIEYGYSLPISRRLNIDFTIGVGYIGGKYIKYEPANGIYVWKSTHRLNWVGPAKAEISLVWLIGCDNYNGRKGGHK